MIQKIKDFVKVNSAKISTAGTTALVLTTGVSASEAGSSGTTSSAITDVGQALTGILKYISGVTSTILGDDLWILGMGFFVVSFICGLCMELSINVQSKNTQNLKQPYRPYLLSASSTAEVRAG